MVVIALAAIWPLAGCQGNPGAGTADALPAPWFENASLARDAQVAGAVAAAVSVPPSSALAAVAATERQVSRNWWDRPNASAPVSTTVGDVERVWRFRDKPGSGGITGLAGPTQAYLFAADDARGTLVYETVASDPATTSTDEVWGTRILVAKRAALVLLSRHFGGPLTYAVTDGASGAGSWVLAESGGRVAGVYLGVTGMWDSVDADVSSRIRAGRVYAGSELTRTLGAELDRANGR